MRKSSLAQIAKREMGEIREIVAPASVNLIDKINNRNLSDQIDSADPTKNHLCTLTNVDNLWSCGCTIVNLHELKIGDLVEISYLPYSQKYLSEYEDKLFRGRVCATFDGDALLYYDTTNGRVVKSVYVDGCSYGFNDCLGYDLCIKKLKIDK